MINVYLEDQSFSYDVHSLVKAFYPGEDVSIAEYDRACPIAADFSGFAVRYEPRDPGDRDPGDRDPGDGAVVSPSDPGDGAVVNVVCSALEDGRTLASETAHISDLGRTEVKSVMKQALYRLLSAYTNQKLPWGTLTGIRPTKIPMKMIMEGKNDDEIKLYLDNTYYVSDGKIKLATEIAHLEKNIIESTHGVEGFSLYVGIPFCPTTCMYCSFTSYPIVKFKDMVDTYLDTLEKELCEVGKLNTGRYLDSVYIGGGTPTTLEPEQIERLNGMIRKYFDFANVKEYTMEAGRPDSLTIEKLAAMKKCGIGRISVNPQTMHDETLKIIGRRHSVADTIRAFNMAREAGFDNINMDIILGLPGEDAKMVSETLDEIAKLGPDSLTVHSMAIKRAAGMHQFLMEHEEIKSINTPEMMDMAVAAAKAQGLNPYYLYRQKNMAGNLENVGFAREGKYGLYNILIMEEIQSIVACGAGTVTKRVYSEHSRMYPGDVAVGNVYPGDVAVGNGRIERCDNVKDVSLYIAKIDEMIERKRQLFK